ncbi:MAG: glycosyltransferase family 2 protein [Solirubrobacteraceae bacterium]
MTAGLVSVLVPAYEAERYLGAALKSALAQDHPAFEVIVIDDGSTDATAAIAKEHPVRLIELPANRGPAAARNAGLAAARGEYVTVLDADDLWPGDRLSLQVGHLERHPEHDLVMGLTVAFVTPGEVRPAHFPAAHDGEPLQAHAGTMLCRRTLFDRIGPWDESFRHAEDVDWLSRAKDAGALAGEVDEVVLHYRIHAANISRDKTVNGAAMLRVLRDSVRRQQTPLVSVVIPLHDGAAFIADALATVAAQTHPAVETIVVDDGSHDRGAEIAAAHPGVRVLRQPQAGPGAARNAGVAVSSGAFLAFLDQDDLWHADKLARQLAALRAEPGADLALCHLDMLVTDGLERPGWFPEAWLTTPQPGYIPSAWLLRRSAWARVGRFDESYAIASDADWLSRFSDAGLHATMLPDTLACWRVHGDNGSYDRETMQRELFTVFRRGLRRREQDVAHD